MYKQEIKTVNDHQIRKQLVLLIEHMTIIFMNTAIKEEIKHSNEI